MKICFIALTAYPLLSGKNLGHIVGPDVHTILLGRELVKHGFEVTFITYNEGGPPTEHINGIDVIKAYRFTDIPCLNPMAKAFSIWRAMEKAKAQIYFHHSGASGVTVLFCRLTGKKYVCNIASDREVDKQVEGLKPADRFRLWLDIKLADAVIVMNEFQKKLLKQNYGRESVVIKHHLPLSGRGRPEKAIPPIVLWVGSIAEVKQPELFLELAKAIPEAIFQMIAARGDNEEYYSRFKETAGKIKNLEFLGFIPFGDTGRYYEGASLLVNTSIVEGFPYSFIQAWMGYTPVVSLNSDPDGVISKYRLGLYSKTYNQIVEDIKALINNKKLNVEMGENARRYVEDNHNIEKIVEQYINIFNRMVKSEKDR